MNQKEYVCTVCPMSCRVTVIEHSDQSLSTSGNTCKRGEKYAIAEHTNPQRMITTTVKVTDGLIPRLSVISTNPVPKKTLKACLEVLYKTNVKAPIVGGDLIVKNICNTGVDIIASRTIKKG